MTDSAKFIPPFTLEVQVRESTKGSSKIPYFGHVKVKHENVQALIDWFAEQEPDQFNFVELPLRGWDRETVSSQYISAVAEPRDPNRMGKFIGRHSRQKS